MAARIETLTPDEAEALFEAAEIVRKGPAWSSSIEKIEALNRAVKKLRHADTLHITPET